MLSLVTISLCLGVHFVFTANILIVYDLPSPSHQLWNYVFAEGLMDRGHNVTMLGAFTRMAKKTDKYHPLVVEGVLNVIQKNPDYNIEQHLSTINMFQFVTFQMKYDLTVCNHSYHTNGFRTLLDYPKDFKFDLIVVDVTLTPCFVPLIQRFGYPPTIGVTAFLLPSFVSNNFGNGIQPSYLPAYFSQFSEDMGFFQRVLNYIFTRLDIFVKGVGRNRIEVLARKVFGEDLHALEKIERHMTLLLCNLNPAVSYPQPLTPNIIPVGGLHVKQAKELPRDLLTIVENAKEGVILFALGTNVRSANLRDEVKRALLEAFAKLNQTVIWKFETELNNLPKNVIIRKWLPQNDILGHLNTKLFISHGGALSTFEAIYHAVPIIGMPFFIDQRVNVNSMVRKKLALKVDVHNFTSDELLERINEALTNPVYLHNSKEYSRRMRDQPQPPLERAVFWAEYAMRHNGANFLNPKSRDMPIFVSSCSDVILFLMLLTIFIAFISFVVVKKLILPFIAKPRKKQKLY